MALEILQLGRVDYLPTLEAMQRFTELRTLAGSTASTSGDADQLWICEHPPVYTQGLAGKAEHIFNAGAIPVVQTNRGGQVTFHGPGQVVAYPLLDLRRAGYFVKEYVYRMEEALLRTLLHFGVTGHRVGGAPGIYVRLEDPFGHAPLPNRPGPHSAGALHPQKNEPDFSGLGKIAALGIKVSRNCTYHGLALNVDMDLEPYARINPCGYRQLQTVDLSTIGVQASWDDVAAILGRLLVSQLAP